MAKTKNRYVDPVEGSVTVIKRDERHLYGTEILMNNGFCIILFSMIFGLLPTSLYGSRLKYYRCSFANFYAIMFGYCMIVLSILFGPVSIREEFAENPTHGQTDTAVLILIKVTHVCGFLFLLFRGYYVATKIPQIWSQLAKLTQISVIDLHGKKYRCLKKLRRFSMYAFSTYVLTMILNESNVFYGQAETMMPQFLLYYQLQFIEFSRTSLFLIQFGFYVWKLCSFSHILVSILAGYLIVAVTVCLRAANDHLLSLFEEESNCLLRKGKEKLKYVDKTSTSLEHQERKYLDAFNKVKNIQVLAENVVGSISKTFGVSLIVEVLILIANLLVAFFYILVPVSTTNTALADYGLNGFLMSAYDNESSSVIKEVFTNYLKNSGKLDNVTPTLEFLSFGRVVTLLGEAFIHSYFFYKLCCKATEMVIESKEPLQILKTIPYEKYSAGVQNKIEMLKNDLASTNISMTAANYFQINKFAVTSITSALTTYVIVLLQFSQQDQNKKVE